MIFSHSEWLLVCWVSGNLLSVPTMKPLHILTLAVTAVILAGCASQPKPEERPYTDAEVKQFALEMLSRSGLPYEDYEKVRNAILHPKVPSVGKDLPLQRSGRG